MKYKYEGEWKDLTVKASDTLPIGTIVDYDGDTVPSGYEEVEETEDYSTSETNTGKKWIDGKTIYRKVLIIPNNQIFQNALNIPHNISNIDFILPTSRCSLWDGRMKQSILMPSTVSNSSNDLGIRITDTNITFVGSDTWGINDDRSLYIVIEYTKTTDGGAA